MWIWYACFFAFGLTVPSILKWLNGLSIRHAAKLEGQGIIDDAKDKAADIKTESKKVTRDIKDELSEKIDDSQQLAQPRVSGLKNAIHKHKTIINKINKKNSKKINAVKSEWQSYNDQVANKKNKLQNKHKEVKSLENKYAQKILEQHKLEKEKINLSIKTKLMRQSEANAKINEESIEEEARLNAERDAKNFICRVLNLSLIHI